METMTKSKNMKIILLLFLFWSGVAAKGQEPLLDILKDELHEEMKAYASADPVPYYICYRVEESYDHLVSASMGALMQSFSNPQRLLTAQVRVGNHRFDCFHESGNLRPLTTQAYKLPMENSEPAIRQVLWQASRQAYRNASSRYAMLQSGQQGKQKDTVADYTTCMPTVFVEKKLSGKYLNPDRKKWEERTKKLSAIFKEYPEITEGMVEISFRTERRYFVSSEQVVLAENLTYANLKVSAWTKAEDEMDLPLYLNYFAYLPDNLPSDKTLEKDIRRLAQKLKALRVAPVVDPYTAPAILSSSAAGIFFHEIFGHRIEAQRMKKATDGRTFYGLLGNLVLPPEFSVYDDPTLKSFNGQDLNGWYRHDDEGVPAEKVLAVDKGILKDFLTTRTPIGKFPTSNGHARAASGFYPTSRQSNLIIETSRKYSDQELRRLLIEEAKKQGKEYGFYLAEVNSGFTNTTTIAPNSFNVIPTEVYRVYTDGRPDELVRGVDLVGTPLSMFSLIVCGGDKQEVFSGMCGAESGKVPVTAIAPALFVSKIEFQKKGQNTSDKTPLLPRHY